MHVTNLYIFLKHGGVMRRGITKLQYIVGIPAVIVCIYFVLKYGGVFNV